MPNTISCSSSFSSNADELHHLASKETKWLFGTISNSAPSLNSILDNFLTLASTSKLPSLASREGFLLYKDLRAIGNDIDRPSLPETDDLVETARKIKAIRQHMEGKSTLLNLKEYTSFTELETALRALATSLQNKPVSEEMLNSIKCLIELNSRLFEWLVTPSNQDNSFQRLRALRPLHPPLFQELIGYLCSRKEINFSFTKLNPDELKELAPYFTRVVCQNKPAHLEILKNAAKLTSLGITYSSSVDEVLAQLPNPTNLQMLVIEECEITTLPTIAHNVKKLHLVKCTKFNQALPREMNQLEELRIRKCYAFNSALPVEMKNLRSLEIISCYAFNQPLPEAVEELQVLHLYDNERFNQPLPARMDNLKILEITGDRIIWPLRIDFNQPLPKKLDKLETLEIQSKLFNHPLPESMNRLQKCIITSQQFDPLSHPLETVVTWLRFQDISAPPYARFRQANRVQISRAILANQNIMQQITNAPQKYLTVIDFLGDDKEIKDKHPQIYLFTMLNSLEKKLTRESWKECDTDAELYESEKAVLERFKQDIKEDYATDYLLSMIQFFPKLTTFIFTFAKENLQADLARLQVTLETQPRATRALLLPFLSPEAIEKTILENPYSYEQDNKLQGLFCKLANFKQVFDPASPSADMRLWEFKIQIKSIPLELLARLSLRKSEAELILFFMNLNTFSELQLTCMVPLLSNSTLIQFLAGQHPAAHAVHLLSATHAQREHYLQSEILLKLVQKELEQDIRVPLQGLASNQEESQKVLAKLEAIKISLELKLKQIAAILLNLKKKLASTPSLEILESKIQKELTQIKDALQQKQEEIMHRLGIEELVEVPADFYDQITGELMIEPCSDKQGHTIDRSTWEMLLSKTGKNPFTTTTLKLEELTPNQDLQDKLNEFKKAHPGLFNDAG